MRYNVVGADKESGDDVDVTFEAPSQQDAERIAHDKGILVAAMKVMPPLGDGAITLVEDEPAPATNGNPAAHGSQAGSHGSVHGHDPAHTPADAHAHPAAAHPPAHAHGKITINAGNPSDTAHTSEGTGPMVHHVEASLEFHVLLNQSLYLLESAVNKHIRDGWEPQGGIAVGVSNNAMQYFQAMTRRKKLA